VNSARVFYVTVLRTSFKGDNAFAWKEVSRGTFSIFIEKALNGWRRGSVSEAGRESYTIEFEVDDVEHEYERLKSVGVQFVKELTMQPGRRRSVWFRVYVVRTFWTS
jgi:hypothetical protein